MRFTVAAGAAGVAIAVVGLVGLWTAARPVTLQTCLQRIKTLKKSIAAYELRMLACCLDDKARESVSRTIDQARLNLRYWLHARDSMRVG